MDAKNNKDVDKHCYNDNCPFQRPHTHVVTNNGTYIKYIIEKPVVKVQNEWRQENV